MFCGPPLPSQHWPWLAESQQLSHTTSPVVSNSHLLVIRQWLAIQKLRSKIRKKVDRKASKGRKIRYHVHSKLVSFMAPIDNCTMNDDARLVSS
ncbi:UNVERIFIED_CONTAM: hypothetical protein K2H54_036205 [Gekko kuhli]